MKELKYPEKVEMLKKAVDVSGKKLLHGKPSDKKIDTQIEILMNTNSISKGMLEEEKTRIFSKLDINMSKEEVEKSITDSLYKLIGFDKFGPLDNGFWRNFGSAPFFQEFEDKKKKPGIGMDTIFGDKFEKNHSVAHDIIWCIEDLLRRFLTKKENASKKENVISKYKSLDDLEENLPVKKIAEEAKIFYMDESKSYKERLRVFDKYGEEDSCIHQPNNIYLKKIFDIYFEKGYVQRHEMVSCLDVVHWWIEELEVGRKKIDYSKNHYHPSLINKKRNYEPSDKAIERLRKFYENIILQEGVANFELDW